MSNLPLFALALPMLAVLTTSSLWAMQLNIGHLIGRRMTGLNAVSPRPAPESIQRTRGLLRRLAVPQFLLALLALTSYHVQIITRLSSGYSVWYIWLAALLTETSNFVFTDNVQGPKNLISTNIRHFGPTEVIRYMVIYAAIQAGLYSSFLPPA